MATGRVPTTANSPLTAKGDLFGYSTTQARVPVGNDGETIVADSSTSTGLRYQPTQAAGKNYIINGSYEIWQRGTSFALTSGNVVYCSDRWQGYSPASGRTITRQGALTTGYYARVARDSSNSSTGVIYYGSTLESASTVNLIGKTVTMSFNARKGANYTGSDLLGAYIVYGTGTDQNLFSGLTGQTTVVTSNVTLTTSFQRFSITGTVSATATQMAVYFLYSPTGTAGANDYFEVDDVQLELGSVATTFTPAGGTLQGELAACQRYYEEFSGTEGNSIVCVNHAYLTTATFGSLYYKVNKRVAPTIAISGGTSGALNAAASVISGTVGFTEILTYCTRVNVTGASGLVVGNASGVYLSYSKITISAEL